MNLWEKIIIEWINCLKVLEEPVTSTRELQNGIFYINFLNLIKWKTHKKEEDNNQENIIIQFLEDQYPSFKFNKDDSTEHIYVASVLLVHLCRNPSAIHSLQYNMCDKLADETQNRLKFFLENLLPLGKDVTKETIKEVITEVENLSLCSSSSKKSPFPNLSISARSTGRSKRLLTERLQELRDVKCNLALERFTNAELQNDIAKQQDKIKCLQRKLEEKTEQLKILRDERMGPSTPLPSSRGKKNTEDDLRYYGRYIDDLETQLGKRQDEIDRLETERDALVKQLASARKSSVRYKESLASCESSLESLADKIELRDRELSALRAHNEELRAHIKGLSRNPAEQSFEGDDAPAALSNTMSMNTSEALSTVIEIQLQEAREESAVLRAQVDSLKEKLDLLAKDYKSALEANRDLRTELKAEFARARADMDTRRQELDTWKASVAELQEIKKSLAAERDDLWSSLERKEEELSNARQSNIALNEELDDAREQLRASVADVARLRAEKEFLAAETEDLRSSLSRSEKELSDTKQSNVALNTELDSLKADATNLQDLLANEKTNSASLNAALELTRSEMADHVARIDELGANRDFYRSIVENCGGLLRDILRANDRFVRSREIDDNDLDNSTINDLVTYIEQTLRAYDTMCASYKCQVEELTITLDETREILSERQSTVARLEEDKRQTDSLLIHQKEMIRKYSEDIETLERIRDEKCVLEQSVCELKRDSIRKNESLKRLGALVGDLKEDYKRMKTETERSVVNCRNAGKLVSEKLQRSYRTLARDLDEAQREKEKLECDYNCTKEKLLNAEKVIFALHQTTVEYKETMDALEEKQRTLYNELNETKLIAENLRRTNQTLVATSAEATSNLENLRTENRDLSRELETANDRIDSLEREISEAMAQLVSKQEEINELVANVSSLTGEKQHLMRLHEEIIDARNKEMRTKEDELSTLRTKLDELTNEASARESKMNEVIVDLQEVRAGQDAVLVKQEAALREKCLLMDELQERFDNTRKLLSDELENTKLLANEYQIRISQLENQINAQNGTLLDTREMLSDLSAELDANKRRCELMQASQAEMARLREELERSTRDLSVVVSKTRSDCDFPHQDSQREEGDDTSDIVVKTALDEMRDARTVISELSRAYAELRKTTAEQRDREEEEMQGLRNRIQELEIIAQKRNDYLKNLIRSKETLKDCLQRLFVSQRDSDAVLTALQRKWNETLTRFQDVLRAEDSVCDEIKQLRAKKASLEIALSKYRADHSESVKATARILWERFLWTEQTLLDTYLCSAHERECLDILNRAEDGNEFRQDEMAIDARLEECRALRADATKSEMEMESFSDLATIYENGLKSGEIKSYAETEKKLQAQIGQLTKERKELKDKMDVVRARNVKLEKNIDDLRAEIKKLKTEVAPPTTEADSTELKSLRDETERLREQNRRLREETEESAKIAKQDFDNRLKDVHASYEQKLDDMKQKVKAAYNEQVTKLNKEQEKIIQDRLQSQMKMMCQRHGEELDRYKAHISELSTQLWSVGEKLLSEQQRKDEALKRLRERNCQLAEIETDQPITISGKIKVEKQEMLSENSQQTETKVTTLATTEETLERGHSIRSIQALGNAFKTEDEDEVFDNVYLADMKRGNCLPTTDIDRLSVLQMRNSLCKPHLKSSYPAEMQFLPATLTEEEIKTGSPEENFNDSLSQSLLPEQKARKKDRTQTSYKKPGPPTPSKNGGRPSLQNNELKSPSSRVLRERNVDRKATSTTPHSLKNLFSLKRQDENVSTTPKGRRLSNLFRKPKAANRPMNE